MGVRTVFVSSSDVGLIKEGTPDAVTPLVIEAVFSL